MSEPPETAAPAPKPSAGRLLREAREKQGLHIAALAAAIKVTPKKLELLESDRFAELPDATFTRALAQTVCRALKTDPAPVMQLLPPPPGHRLEHVGEGLNTPFRERPGALVQRDWLQTAASPVFWIVGLLLVATATLYFLPSSLGALGTVRQRPASAPSPRAAVEPGMPPDVGNAGASAPADTIGFAALAASAAQPVSGVTAPSLALPVAASGSADGAHPTPSLAAEQASAALPAAMLQLRVSAASWVEVTDAQGKALVARLLHPGEVVGVDGAPPLKLRIGNAAGTQVIFRGQPTELQAYTRDNVARLELK
jgi:cytoskeleton protein RodZ